MAEAAAVEAAVEAEAEAVAAAAEAVAAALALGRSLLVAPPRSTPSASPYPTLHHLASAA